MVFGIFKKRVRLEDEPEIMPPYDSLFKVVVGYKPEDAKMAEKNFHKLKCLLPEEQASADTEVDETPKELCEYHYKLALTSAPISFTVNAIKKGTTKPKQMVSNGITFNAHRVVGQERGSCIMQLKRKPDAREAVGNVKFDLSEDPGDKSLMIMLVEAQGLVNTDKKRKLNPYVNIIRNHDKRSDIIHRTNCKYGQSEDVTWNQFLIRCDSLFKRCSDIEFELYTWIKDWRRKPPRMVSTTKVSIEEIMNDEDGFIKTKFKADDKSKIGSLSISWKFVDEFPTLLDYMRGGMTLSTVIAGDATMKKYKAKMDVVTKNIQDIMQHYTRESCSLFEYMPTGTTFDTILPEVMDKAKKIESGAGYMVFIFFASTPKNKGFDSVKFLESSLLPMTIIILGVGKKKQYECLDVIKEEMINQCATDFLKKKRTNRVNFDWQFVDPKTGAVEDEILRTLHQDITEYTYLNDITPGSGPSESETESGSSKSRRRKRGKKAAATEEPKQGLSVLQHEDVPVPAPPPPVKGAKKTKK